MLVRITRCRAIPCYATHRQPTWKLRRALLFGLYECLDAMRSSSTTCYDLFSGKEITADLQVNILISGCSRMKVVDINVCSEGETDSYELSKKDNLLTSNTIRPV